MRLPPLTFVVLDTETTGFVPRVHQIIEYASMRVEKGEVTDTFEQLFHAEEVPPHVEVLTRIRTEDIADKPLFTEHAQDILSRIPDDAVIVGQNVGFDLGMLKGSGIDLTARPWIDTSMLASLVFPELHSYSLGYLSTALNLDHEPQHRALGDVRATLSLLEKCWERLNELTPEMHEQALSVMSRASEGYRRLFAALPAGTAKKLPSWLATAAEGAKSAVTPRTLPLPDVKTVCILEDSLDPQHLLRILAGSVQQEKTRTWIAVKNIDTQLERFGPSIKAWEAAKKLRVVYAPSQVVDTDAAARLHASDAYTADEATLALKLLWYKPATRSDFPLHGGEESVWHGKVACTETSPAYLKQLEALPGTVLLDHRQLLRFLSDPANPAKEGLATHPHIVLDDASMLEDTATKAFGWMCVLDDLRAASRGDDTLTKFTDLLQLWIEKVRQSQDVRYLTESDLTSHEAKGLREQLNTVRSGTLTPQVQRQLEHLEKMLDPANLGDRFAWIEQRQNGNQFIQSVPDRIATLLEGTLYGEYPTTLIVPPQSAGTLAEVCPVSTPVRTDPPDGASDGPMPISFPIGRTPDMILQNVPTGRTVLLLPTKGMIEGLYVRHTERLEEQNVRLICQGLSGGMGRMQSEFLSSTTPVVWIITPWMFEGAELPRHSVDHLILASLPFDFYSHPVISRRSARYRDSFIDYLFPRLLHRLFRVLRTFSFIRTPEADVEVLDDRIRTKDYGKKVVAYLSQFAVAAPSAPVDGAVLQPPPPVKPAKEKKAAKAKKPAKPKDQLPLF